MRKTFSGHQGRLNCVKWIRRDQSSSFYSTISRSRIENLFLLDSPNDFSYFLSASVDKTVGLWKGKDEDVGHHIFLSKIDSAVFSSMLVCEIYVTRWP